MNYKKSVLKGYPLILTGLVFLVFIFSFQEMSLGLVAFKMLAVALGVLLLWRVHSAEGSVRSGGSNLKKAIYSIVESSLFVGLLIIFLWREPMSILALVGLFVFGVILKGLGIYTEIGGEFR
jgi:hypothetical protein